jgi:hypothetical protein
LNTFIYILFAIYFIGYISFSISEMGAGLSLTKQQIILLVKNELTKEYLKMDSARCPYNNDGYIAYESFDDDEKYYKNIRTLNKILYELDCK